MCGIAGVINHDKKNLCEVLRIMTKTLAHRGPDGENHWINESKTIGFGHRRLKIIDLSSTGGRQPMHSPDGRYTINFNGEIYNYIEIKNRLIKKAMNLPAPAIRKFYLPSIPRKREMSAGTRRDVCLCRLG